MTEDGQPETYAQSASRLIRPWLTKSVIAVLTAFGMAFIAYFTGLIPKFLDPYFGAVPQHEIAVAVTREKDGLGIDGGRATISEVGDSGSTDEADDKVILDSQLLKDGDAKLLAKTSSKSARIDIVYEAGGTIYRYRKLLPFTEMTTLSLRFPADFSYPGKGQAARPPAINLISPLGDATQVPGNDSAIIQNKDSLDNAFGEASLSLDAVTEQMRKAREAREAATAEKP